MKLFDSGFGSVKLISKTDVVDDFTPNDLDKTLTCGVSQIVKMEVINKKFNMGKLLKGLGYDISQSNMYCPFHEDEMSGKPSAKYHFSTDRLWCFSENKMYTAWHVLKLLYGQDMESLFNKCWAELPREERLEFLDKYNKGRDNKVGDSKEVVLMSRYHSTADLFKEHKVSYTQYKNALFRIFEDISYTMENSKS